MDLDDARMASLEGDYERALAIVDSILAGQPNDIEALRLKGNTIDLKILACMRPVGIESRESEIVTARECYEKILAQDPHDYPALLDLADHCRNFGRKPEAQEQYKRLVDLLRVAAENGEDVADFLSDAIQNYRELM